MDLPTGRPPILAKPVHPAANAPREAPQRPRITGRPGSGARKDPGRNPVRAMHSGFTLNRLKGSGEAVALQKLEHEVGALGRLLELEEVRRTRHVVVVEVAAPRDIP